MTEWFTEYDEEDGMGDVVTIDTDAGQDVVNDMAYHRPNCNVTAEDNCSCDLPQRVNAIEREAAIKAAGRIAALPRRFPPSVEKPRLFVLRRDEDISGTSGTGTVAQGVVFSDGTCAMRWLTDKSSTAVYASIEDLDAIHGHGGSTVIEYLDTFEGKTDV